MAVSVEQSPYFTARAQKGDLLVREAPKFDLESYIANYEGRTRLIRLNYIARLCPPLALEALRLAIPEAKAAKDPNAYITFTELLHELDADNPQAVPDVDWVERRNKENQRETERLEHELRGYKNNLIKESIRMGQEDLANHYMSMSEFDQSSKAFQKMREYCTTPKHIAEMTMKLVYTSIASSNWLLTQSHCNKARALSLKPEDKEKFEPVIEACTGVAYLGAGEYSIAAEAFVKADPSFISVESVAGIHASKAILTGNDIAVYGGLCALASMDRDDLRSTVLEDAKFRTFLELEPHIRRAISFFCDGKYSQCLEVLEAYRNDYLLDIYLGHRVEDLYTRIRSKSIIQYFIPFSHVTLAALAVAFPRPGTANTTPELIEEELVDMIQAGLLNARIDTVDQLLVAPPKDARAEAHQGVLETAQELEHQLRLKLHKMNMAQAGLELQAAKTGKSSQQHKTGGGMQSAALASDGGYTGMGMSMTEI